MKAYYIPPRSASIEAVEQLIQEWIGRGSNYYVSIIQSAQLGYEPLFNQLAKSFNTKVHLSKQQYANYQGIPGLDKFGTCDARTQIHACASNRVGMIVYISLNVATHHTVMTYIYTYFTGSWMYIHVVWR